VGSSTKVREEPGRGLLLPSGAGGVISLTSVDRGIVPLLEGVADNFLVMVDLATDGTGEGSDCLLDSLTNCGFGAAVSFIRGRCMIDGPDEGRDCLLDSLTDGGLDTSLTCIRGVTDGPEEGRDCRLDSLTDGGFGVATSSERVCGVSVLAKLTGGADSLRFL
jgi:hypothetical protein